MSSTSTRVVFVALAVAFGALFPRESAAESNSPEICKTACFNGLRASLSSCAEQRDLDPDTCIAEAFRPFEACFLTCVQSGFMSIYRLSSDRFLLTVIPAERRPPLVPPGLARFHISTVPIVEGVKLSSGMFPSMETLSDYILSAYQSASDTDNSSGGGCTRPEECVFTEPPRIIMVFPQGGPGFMPLGIGGSNFASPTIPYVNGTPSIALFSWSIQNLPLIGSISVGFTIVPPAAPKGAGDVKVEYLSQRSNPFPFSKN